MKYCKNCGTEIADGQRFCSSCGSPVDDYTQQQFNQQPNYSQQYNQQPDYSQQPYNQQPTYLRQQINTLVNSAFGKGLASVIIFWLPIGSLISIILGSVAIKRSKKANLDARSAGVPISGKNIAALILGIVGLVLGICVTVYYCLIIIAAIFGSADIFMSGILPDSLPDSYYSI